MVPSKADRILSRYRPIAPKPAVATAVVGLLSPPHPLPYHTPFKNPSFSSSVSSGKPKRARRRRENNKGAGRSSEGASASLIRVREEDLLLRSISGHETLTTECSRSGSLTDFPRVGTRTGYSGMATSSSGAGTRTEYSGMIARCSGVESQMEYPGMAARTSGVETQMEYSGMVARGSRVETRMVRPRIGTPTEYSGFAGSLLQHSGFEGKDSKTGSRMGATTQVEYSGSVATRDSSGTGVTQTGYLASRETCAEALIEYSGVSAATRWDQDSCGKSPRVEPVPVTLSLLPEVPSHSNGSSTCSSSPPTTTPPSLDLERVKQAYGASSEPVLLGDDSSGQVLWYNSAYSRASAVSQSKGPATPYIDPLGLRTPLSHFTSGSRTITLWGFLRKLIFMDLDSPEATLPTTPTTLAIGSSIVSLESITEVHPNPTSCNPQLNTLAQQEDILKTELEQCPCPALASVPCSPAGYRVQWTNAAFQKMVTGRPLSELCTNTQRKVGDAGWCNSASSISSSISRGEHSLLPKRVVNTTEGEVSLLCSQNVIIPSTAAAFSGRVNIRYWTKSSSNRPGESSSMTTPCDVVRIQSPDMLIWKFDVAASLSLSTCT